MCNSTTSPSIPVADARGTAMTLSVKVMNGSFEASIRQLTTPLNGQFPRPWMTDPPNPWEAVVFVVGKNQRHGYPVDIVGPHDAYLDALCQRTAKCGHDRTSESRPL
jgi:hypothetical protein